MTHADQLAAESERLERQMEVLIEQRRTSDAGEWADYEIRAVRGEGGFAEHATYALGFSEEDFGMRDRVAVSCTICGAIFIDTLRVMRRHRIECGWS